MWRSGSPPRVGTNRVSASRPESDSGLRAGTAGQFLVVVRRRRRRLPAERTVALSPERPSPVARRRRRRQRPVHFFALSIGTSVTSFRFFPVSCFPARSTGPAVSVRASVSACAPFVPARAPVPVIGSARAPCPSSPARRHRPRLGPRHNGVSLFLVRTLESAGSAVTIALWRPALVCPAISEPVPAHASG